MYVSVSFERLVDVRGKMIEKKMRKDSERGKTKRRKKADKKKTEDLYRTNTTLSIWHTK